MRKIIGIDKDHSTVIHGNRSVTDRISVYPDYAAFVQTIEDELHTLNSTRVVGKFYYLEQRTTGTIPNNGYSRK